MVTAITEMILYFQQLQRLLAVAVAGIMLEEVKQMVVVAALVGVEEIPTMELELQAVREQPIKDLLAVLEIQVMCQVLAVVVLMDLVKTHRAVVAVEQEAQV
jgi:hypothetical protein